MAGLTARQLVRLMVGASLAYGLWDQTAGLPIRSDAGLALALAAPGVLLALVPAWRPPARPVGPGCLLFAVSAGASCGDARQPDLDGRSRPQSGWAELAPRPEWISASGPMIWMTATRPSRPRAVRWSAAHDGRVQARLDLVALEGGMARFGTRNGHAVARARRGRHRGCSGTADDATQEELLAGRAQFLNAQTAPFQVLVRAEPVDLDGHLRRVQARAETLRRAVRALLATTSAFSQALAHQRTLLERHCYVVLPDQTAEIPAVSVGRRLRARVPVARSPG